MGKLVDPVQERADHQSGRHTFPERVSGKDNTKGKRQKTLLGSIPVRLDFSQGSPFRKDFPPGQMPPDSPSEDRLEEIEEEGQIFWRIRDSGTMRPFRTPIVSSTISFIPHK